MKRVRRTLSVAIGSFAAVAVFATVACKAQTEAQKSLDRLKTLTGTWEGVGAAGDKLRVNFRVTSNGTSIMSEMIADPDNMITMFSVDNNRLLMTHFCAAGNEPRMVGTLLPDGSTFDFTFLDGMNFNDSQPGHMDHLTLKIADASHHTEDFTFVTQDGKHVEHDHYDLHRVDTGSGSATHAQLRPMH